MGSAARYPVVLTGARVLLREVDPDDAAAAMAWAGDPEFFRYMAFEPMATEAEERQFLLGLQAEARERPRRQFHLAVVWRETDELIGMARIGIAKPEHREGDIGYGVRLDRARQGITTEAARLLLAFGFEELELHRIFAFHHPDNIASQRVMEKLGMQREGVLRENMLKQGRWRDSIVHSILESEWLAQRGAHA